ncbi:type VI secretion system tip protein VgrG [Lentisphaerota bacterium ZTH]|nr:type VI secretion system tip protein VgrG [Lentisphaerota bacterium]WET05214.1 type VI secretion system tip protein VgrG [Lentisphaerota bacterium ZTH]
MTKYTQQNRNLQIEIEGKTGKDESGNNYVLLSQIMEGSYQELAQPFKLILKLASPVTSSPLTAADMLGRNTTVKLKKDDDTWRLFNGILSGFCCKGYYSYAECGHEVYNTDLYEYEAVLSPKLLMLKNSIKNRVFHDKKPTAVITSILSDWNIEYESKLTSSEDDTKAYYEIEQVVQYEESDLDFLSRLLEKDGIFYNFWQGEDDNGNPIHKLVLRDSNPASELDLKFDSGGDSEAVKKFSFGEDVVPNAVRTDNYDFRQADVTFFNYDDTHINQTTELGSYANKMLVNRFDAGFVSTKSKSDASKYRKKLKKLAAARWRSAAYCWHGTTGNRSIASGTGFTMTGFPGNEIKGVVTRVEFTAKTTPFTVLTGTVKKDIKNGFKATFWAHDLEQPFKPQLRTKTPKTFATTSARVITVENIPTSTEETEFQFNSDLGGNPTLLDSSTCRVKILMNWRNTLDDNTPDFSTMWLNARFGQMWADPNSGSFDIPRKGQEVLVSFVNGNLAQPVIVGSLYNSVINPPIDASLTEGIYGNLMRTTAVAANKNGGYDATSSLVDSMPLPMAAYDLGQKKNRKGYSEISMFSMDNGQFSEPSYDDADFMTTWFFPAGAPPISTLVGYKDSLGSGSAGKSMFFEGINMYSNNDVLNQAAQSQIINAGTNIQISAGSSITLEVGRSKITLTDKGIALTNTFGAKNKYAGYVAAYQDVDNNAPEAPSWSLSTFSSSLALVPGLAGLTAPLSSVCGTYLANVKTWWGSECGGMIGNTGVKGLKSNVAGGFDLSSCLENLAKIVNNVIQDVCGNVGTKASLYGGGSINASLNLILQTLLMEGVLLTIIGTITMFLGKSGFKASAIELQTNSMVNSSDEISHDAPVVKLQANPFGGYFNLARQIGDMAGAGNVVTGMMQQAAITQHKLDLIEIEMRTLKKDEMQLQDSSTGVQENNSKVSEEELEAHNDSAQVLESNVDVVKDEAGVVNDEAKVSKAEQKLAESEVKATGQKLEAVENDIRTMIIQNNLMDCELM